MLKQRMRSLGKKLDLATYAKDTVGVFRLAGLSPGQWVSDDTVQVPIPVLYRLYHLGRAYDLHQLKNLHPAAGVVLDFVSIQLLIQELEQVADLVADPVLRHYTGLLIPYLTATRSETKWRLVVSVPQ